MGTPGSVCTAAQGRGGKPTMFYIALLAGLLLPLVQARTLIYTKEQIKPGFDSEVDDDSPLIEICNGCVIMQAMNMTVVQVINVHLTPPPIAEGRGSLSPAAATESFTQGSSDQPFDQSYLPTYFSNCNGCSIFSANSISTTQTVNLTMPDGRDEQEYC